MITSEVLTVREILKTLPGDDKIIDVQIPGNVDVWIEI